MIFAAVTILLFGFTAAQDCTGQTNGYFVADPDNCKAYWTCSNGNHINKQSCPLDYLFDEAKQLCNYADQVKCVSCPGEGVAQIPFRGSCIKYYLCLDGAKILRECVEGLFFDELNSQCDIEANVDCNDCPAVDDPAVIEFRHNKYDCTGYYICKDGAREPFSCYDGLEWNKEINKCDLPDNANCTAASSSGPGGTTLPPTTGAF